MVFKKTTRFLGLFFVFVMGFLISTQTAKAFAFIGWYWDNPNDLTYYVAASTIQEGYESFADFGGKAWNNSSKVEIKRTTTNAIHDGTLTHVVSTNEIDIGPFYAQADAYKKDGSACVVGRVCTAYKGKVTINDEKYEDLTSITRKYETITHEFGHILGLAHELYVRPSVMIGREGWCDCSYPQAEDYKGINARYE